MKAWGLVAVVPILATLANAESLGDVAKRERERREKTKQGSTGTETKVIHEEDLVAAPAKGIKGTFNPSAGSRSGAKGADVPPKGSPSVASTSSSGSAGSAPLTEVEGKRAAALRQLESSYQAIAGIAWDLVRAAREYNQVCTQTEFAVVRRCVALANTIEQLVVSIAASMEEAEDAARQGWLAPGDVREMRKRYGMDDLFWDHLVDLVRRHGR